MKLDIQGCTAEGFRIALDISASEAEKADLTAFLEAVDTADIVAQLVQLAAVAQKLEGERRPAWFLKPGVLSEPEPEAKPGMFRRSMQATKNKLAAAKTAGTAAGQAVVSAASTGVGASWAAVRGVADSGGATVVQVTGWYNAALGSRDFSKEIDCWMRETFASGSATIYDKAMDAAYNASNHAGGGYHRLFDGGHDLIGAWRAIAEAVPDDNFLQRVDGYMGALWKDFVTPMGLPVVTLDRDQFNAVAAVFADSFGVSKAWMVDMASLTATEFLGSVTGILTLALHWNKEDVEKFSSLVGSFGLSAMVSANPFLALVAIISLARAYQEAKRKQDYGSLFLSITKGGVGSGVVMVVSSLFPGVWIGLMVGICASILAQKALDHGGKLAGEIDWSETASFAVGYIKKSIPFFPSGGMATA